MEGKNAINAWKIQDWWGVRAAYGTGLENRCTRKGTVGSNPSPTASAKRPGKSPGRCFVYTRLPSVYSTA